VLADSGGDQEPIRAWIREKRADGTGYRSWNVRLALASRLVALGVALSVWRHSAGDGVGTVFGALLALSELVIVVQLAVLIRRRGRGR
jgi:glycerol-3-phosphate acyltransferase PlsY